MPATAGRVRMPANNRVHSSAALQTHGIWQSAIGYDPYAPNKEDNKGSSQPNVPNSEPDGDNAYASFQGLLALARITGSNADEARGACKRCGRVGHLSFQCRNFLSVKEDKEKGPEAIEADIASHLGRLKGKLGKGSGKNAAETDSDEDEDSESSDSDYNAEMERLIAQKYGKKCIRKEKSKKKNEDSDVDESDSDSGERKKRGRSKKRRSSKRKHDDSDDSEEDRKKRKKEKRRKRDDSSDDDGKRRRRHRKSRKEKRRRRSHRYSDDSESDASEDTRKHRSRRSRRAASPSDSDASASDDSRVGRGRKRSEKKNRKNHRADEE